MATMVVMAELMMETPMKEMEAITLLTRGEAPAANCVCTMGDVHIYIIHIIKSVLYSQKYWRELNISEFKLVGGLERDRHKYTKYEILPDYTYSSN